MATHCAKRDGVEGLVSEAEFRHLPEENRELLRQLARIPATMPLDPFYSPLRKALLSVAPALEPRYAKILVYHLQAGIDNAEAQHARDRARWDQGLQNTYAAVAHVAALTKSPLLTPERGSD